MSIDDFAIYNAVRSGDFQALQRMAEPAANFPNVRDGCGASYLIVAIYHGPLSLVRELLAAGADPNFPESDGFPTLFAALDRDMPDRYAVIEALLAHGADVQQRGFNDYTALHQAACRDDADAVALLLAHGADPNARTSIDHYATPLEEAEKFGHLAGVAALRRLSMARDCEARRSGG